MVYGRGIVDGKSECHFLGLNNGLDITKVSSFGSDGASDMTGRRVGVATRLKHLCSIISIHCVAHCLSLAAGPVSQRISYLRRFKEILGTFITTLLIARLV